MTLSAKEILDKARRLQLRYRDTEGRWHDVKMAREGNLEAVVPDMVNEDWPKPIVANFVDTVARDLAEMVAPLPAFNCTSTSMQSDAARKFADKRGKIAQWYLVENRVDIQMLTAADHFFTYGTAVFYIEPDFDEKLPRITVEEPLGGYPEYDRWGRITSYTKRWHADAEVIIAQFPEYEPQIRQAAKDFGTSGGSDVEIFRYCDKHQITLVLQAKQPITLVDVANRLGETPIAIAHRAWLTKGEPKGQFDDAIWIQIARDVLAKLQLEATEKAVQAPLALPADVQEIAMGPDAVLRSNQPDKIRRVGMELTPAAFQETAFLQDEIRQGVRYPQARTGNPDASIITGRGIQALMGGFDTQIKSAQMSFRSAFVDVMRLCFKMDEKMWPNATKDVRGSHAGTPFQIAYRPGKDIAGEYHCDVSYGFAAGLDPSRAIVMLLQLRAEKAISRDLFQRQLPLDLNVMEEQTKVNVEDIREAISQSVYAYVQAIPAMAESGQDPGQVIQRVAQIADGIKKGKAIEDVVLAAFAPQPPPPIPGAPGAPGAPDVAAGQGDQAAGGGGGPGLSGGLTASGLMNGVPPGQAGQPPGGRPDLNVMLAGLNGAGNAQMSSFTMRRRRV